MRYKIHYLMVAILGLATPMLMGWGTVYILEELYDKEHMGHGTPVEFVIVLVLIGVVCLGIFLVADLISSAMLLPRDGRRKKHFLLALLLYFFLAVFGWLAVAFLEQGINMLVS